MKLNKILLAISAVGILSFNSCSKDYLEVEPSQFATPEQIGKVAEYDPKILSGFLNGLYSTMSTVGVGGTTGHDDFGQKGIDIYTDFLSGDMAMTVSTYGWYRNLVQLTATPNNTLNENYIPWRFYYRMIASANDIIKAQGGNDAVPALQEGKYFMGQAKAMRAYSYFYLMNLYANEYNPTEKKIVLKITSDSGPQPRATNKEVMDQVVKDLNDAINYLQGFQRADKSAIDRNVAKALLAYAYAYIGDQTSLQNAKNLAKDVIDNSGASILSTTDVTGGFNNIASTSWIWGTDITTNMGLNLISWWGQMDYYSYSYQWAGDRKAIDNGLFAKIPATDARKAQFAVTTNSLNLIPFRKFYDPNRVVGGQRQISTDYVYMRIEEMYLLHAECAAKTGDAASAKQYLKLLLAKRFANASDYAYVDGLSGQALIDEIYLQTRIELWGEGKSYLAMKRNKATINRGTNHLYLPGKSYQYNDPLLTFSVPQAEIINNPNF